MPTALTRPPLRRPAFRFRRRPVPYWLAAVVVALLTAALVGRLVAEAASERDRWGVLRAAVVARHDIDAGTRLASDDTTVRMLPVAVVPEGAVVRPPAGSVSVVDLQAGEIVLGSRLAGPGRSVVAARLPAGTRGIAVPSDHGLPVEVGDRVDVLATFDDELAEDGAPTFPVAVDALVVHVGRDAVTVAVVESAAPRVAYALAAGAVTLVLSGARSQRG